MSAERSGQTQVCNFCCFSSDHAPTLLRHQIKQHQNDPNFRVSCKSCGSKFKSIKSLEHHLKAMHEKQAVLAKQLSMLSNEKEEIEALDVPMDENTERTVSFYFLEGTAPEVNTSDALAAVLQNEAFSFLSDIREKYVTTQSTTDKIVKGLGSVISAYNALLEDKILSKQQQNYVSVDEVKEVFVSLKGQTIFEGVMNRNQQTQFRQQYLCYIKPMPITSGDLAIQFSSKSGFHETPVVNGFAAPFLQVLEQLLQCKDVLYCIDNPLPYEDGRYRTVLDGFCYQSHPLVCKDPFTLAIISYGDDLTPGDTLSAKGSRQALRSFTWTLGNIYPWLRSTLKSILPIAFCKKNCVKNEDALKDFISGINQLSSEEGVVFTINGQPRTFHGFLLFMVGDTPASANFAGLKETYAAWCPCRICLVNKDNIFEEFCEVKSLLRNKELHSRHLAAVCGEDSMNDDSLEDVAEVECSNPSVKYGVNSRSCLLDLKYFDITKGFPLDIMHVLGEGGVLDVNIRLLLSGCLTRSFSLNNVNQMINSIDYGSYKRDKPAEIKTEHLSNNLRQSASQMFLLAHMIPFIVHGHCKEAELKNYNRLLMVVNISFSPDYKEQAADKLRKLIAAYLREFKRLYGVEKMTLKFHFLIHLARQLLLFGPLTQQWAMRFEGFHALLKRLFKILHNATNLPFSLMDRILTRILHEMESSPSGKFLYGGHEIKTVQTVELQHFEWKDAVKSAIPSIKETDCLQLTDHLKFFGHTFKKEDVVQTSSSGDLSFGTVFKMLMFEETPVLLCKSVEFVGFNVKLNAFGIKACAVPSVLPVCLHPTKVIQPLFKIKYRGQWYVLVMNNSNVLDSELDGWNCT